MGEGLARALWPAQYQIESAGLHDGRLNALTVEVMREIGIDITPQYSKRLDQLTNPHFDWMLVLAEPALVAAQRLAPRNMQLWSYPDPVREPGDALTLKAHLRSVRDDLRTRIIQFGETLARQALREHQ